MRRGAVWVVQDREGGCEDEVKQCGGGGQEGKVVVARQGGREHRVRRGVAGTGVSYRAARTGAAQCGTGGAAQRDAARCAGTARRGGARVVYGALGCGSWRRLHREGDGVTGCGVRRRAGCAVQVCGKKNREFGVWPGLCNAGQGGRPRKRGAAR